MLSADQTKGRLHTFLAPSWHFTQTQTPRVLCTEVHRALLLAVTPAHAATRGALPGALQGEDPSTETQCSGREQCWDN